MLISRFSQLTSTLLCVIIKFFRLREWFCCMSLISNQNTNANWRCDLLRFRWPVTDTKCVIATIINGMKSKFWIMKLQQLCLYVCVCVFHHYYSLVLTRSLSNFFFVVFIGNNDIMIAFSIHYVSLCLTIAVLSSLLFLFYFNRIISFHLTK